MSLVSSGLASLAVGLVISLVYWATKLIFDAISANRPLLSGLAVSRHPAGCSSCLASACCPNLQSALSQKARGSADLRVRDTLRGRLSAQRAAAEPPVCQRNSDQPSAAGPPPVDRNQDGPPQKRADGSDPPISQA